MSSERPPRPRGSRARPGGGHALAALLLAGLAAAPALSAAEPASALPEPPAALQPGVDSFDSTLTIDLTHPQPQLARADVHLSLVVPLPVGPQLLRAHLLALDPATTSSGERVALWLPPGSRHQRCLADNPANRDRQLRIPLQMSPLAHPATALTGIHARVALSLSQGPLRRASCAATIGAEVPGSGGAMVTERQGGTLKVRLPPAVAAGLAAVIGVDAAGHDLISRTSLPELAAARPAASSAAAAVPGPTADPASEVATLSCDLARCASLRLEWYDRTQEVTVEVALPLVALPGGVPAVEALADGGIARHPPMTGLAQPLDVAIRDGDDAAALSALAAGANPESPDTDGRRALERAAFLGRDRVLQALLAAHAQVAAADLQGVGALHAAVIADDEVAVRLLLAAGADPRREDGDGRSPIDRAFESGRWRIVRQLLGSTP